MNRIHAIFLIIIGIILVAVCVSQVVIKDEVEGLKDILPTGWALIEESVFGNEVARFKVTSNTECSREVIRKPVFEPFTETINPFIIIIYENKWTQEDYDAEDKRYEDCQKYIEEYPFVAMACSKRNPTVTTKSYSIFIIEDKCDNETSELKNLILDYFEKFK